MKARQLVASGSFGPEALTVAFQAFDAAWQTLAPRVGEDPAAIEAARTRLAHAILTVTHNESRDVSELVARVLALLARGPDAPPASPHDLRPERPQSLEIERPERPEPKA